jgi:hypothetical protein
VSRSRIYLPFLTDTKNHRSSLFANAQSPCSPKTKGLLNCNRSREDPGTAVRLHLVDSVLFTPLLYLRLRRCGIDALALPHPSILVELYFRLPRTSLALDIFNNLCGPKLSYLQCHLIKTWRHSSLASINNSTEGRNGYNT